MCTLVHSSLASLQSARRVKLAKSEEHSLLASLFSIRVHEAQSLKSDFPSVEFSDKLLVEFSDKKGCLMTLYSDASARVAILIILIVERIYI